MNRNGRKANPYGANPEFTPAKWERLQHLIMMNCQAWNGTGFHSGPYEYWDFYAGPGILTREDHPDLAGREGSPILAIRTIRQAYPGPSSVHFFDEDESLVSRLNANIEACFGEPGSARAMDCSNAVDCLIKETPVVDGRHGLAFFDPCGFPDWAAIKRFADARAFKKIDILININSATCKRLLKSPHPYHAAAHFKRKPTLHLSDIKKKKTCLWEPTAGCHQFALAYCTNGPPLEWKASGFHEISSPEGKRIARRIDLTNEERLADSNHTGWLFDDMAGDTL